MRRLIMLMFLVIGVSGISSVRAANQTWTVDRVSDDLTDGDLASHVGSLRFVLAHASSGDHVTFSDVESIHITSPLFVPAGVSVGRRRTEDCGSYTTPHVNIKDLTMTVKPMLTLGANATLRNVNLVGGDVEVESLGDDVDICAVGFGIEYDGDGVAIPLHPKHEALIIRGARTVVHRSDILGAIVVDVGGSDSIIGDSLTSSGESNAGVRNATVSIGANANNAAQRVTVRDPFPRGLVGMLNGTWGGDDLTNHANNWAQRPAILQAYAVTSTTLAISGTANPLSLVDIYLDNQIDVVRQTPVVADASGRFSFTGTLPTGTVTAIAASTLNDPAHPNRVGSSSPWSDGVLVSKISNAPTMSVSATIDNLTKPSVSPAHAGDVLRYSVNIINTGTITINQLITSDNFISPNLALIVGSGTITGNGQLMVATDTGFSVKSLAPGMSITYTVDATVKPLTAPSQATMRLTINAQSLNSRPMARSYALAPQHVVFVPFISR